MKRTLTLFLLLTACLLLCSCQVRTRVMPQADIISQGEAATPSGSIDAATAANEASSASDSVGAASAQPDAASAEPDAEAPTTHSPDAERREYADNVSAEMTADANQDVQRSTTNDMLSPLPQRAQANDADISVQEADAAELTLTERRPIEEADELTVSDDAKAADSLLQYYQTLLTSRLGSMFECQRLYVYWETDQEHTTIHKSSVEHTIITLAGAYDVAVKRPEDALVVDDGWVMRKNPGCIIKMLPPDATAAEAQVMRNALIQRTDWHTIDAVRSHKLLLLSSRLLQSPEGQTAAALLAAITMYPDQFAEIDTAAAVEELLGGSSDTWLYDLD